MIERERSTTGSLTAIRLESARLWLEPLRTAHAEEAVAAFDDARLHRYIGGVPATLDELRARYQRQVTGHSADGSQDWLNWLARDRASGRIAATVQATVHRGVQPDVDPGGNGERSRFVAEVAWVVVPEFQGRGLATEAATAMADWLRAGGVDVLVAYVHPDNEASNGVAARLGLHPTSTLVEGEVRWTT